LSTPPEAKILAQTSSRFVDQIHPSPSSPFLLFPSLLLSSCTILELEILRRKLPTPQNTSDSQPTLHALNDKRISRCGAMSSQRSRHEITLTPYPNHSRSSIPVSLDRRDHSISSTTLSGLPMRQYHHPEVLCTLTEFWCEKLATESASRLTSCFRIERSCAATRRRDRA
jgi:hypothetical protein